MGAKVRRISHLIVAVGDGILIPVLQSSIGYKQSRMNNVRPNPSARVAGWNQALKVGGGGKVGGLPARNDKGAGVPLAFVKQAHL